jgi:hypothetical protein
MVLRVADAPAVKGYEEEGVHDQAHCPVEFLGFGESAVATFVCEDPDAGEDEALHCGVGGPGCESEVRVGEEWDVGDGKVDEGAEVEVIAYDVGHAAEDGGLEAVGGDGVVDLLHGEGREFEDIAIKIDVLGYGVCLCCIDLAAINCRRLRPLWCRATSCVCQWRHA